MLENIENNAHTYKKLGIFANTYMYYMLFI